MFRAHEIDANGIIINTIVVENLDDFPNLIDASNGGAIGQYFADGEWHWSENAIENMASQMRAIRDGELASTDKWVAIAAEAGEPLAVEKAAYRQALRDLPEQEGWPFNVIWPEKP